MVRDKIAEEDPTPWVVVKEKIFPIIIQGCLYENILKKLGTKQLFIRERETSYFLSSSVSTVGHIPFLDLVGTMDAVLL